MQHCIAYCGLTDGYNLDNFFHPLCEKYGLLGLGEDRKEEEELLGQVDLDDEGLRACAMYEVWALDIIKSEVSVTPSFTPPVHAQINAEVVNIGNSIKRLYAYAYQVLPFIYTHLVSASCTLYLMFNAFLKGLAFQPGETITFGFAMPLCNVFLTTLAVFGLLEVGDTILDPFGNECVAAEEPRC